MIAARVRIDTVGTPGAWGFGAGYDLSQLQHRKSIRAAILRRLRPRSTHLLPGLQFRERTRGPVLRRLRQATGRGGSEEGRA